MILVTRFKTNNNFKYAIGGGFGEPKAKQEKLNRELVEEFKNAFVSLFEDYYTNQDFLPYNEFNTQAKINKLFAYQATEQSVLIFINEELYKCTAIRTKSRADVRSRMNHMQKTSRTSEFKAAIEEVKDELIAIIESNGITFGPKVEQIEPTLQSQITDARQEVKPAPDVESEELQFPELQVKIDRAVDIYSSITNQNKESYRGFGISKLSLFIATVIDREGLSTCHISTSENHDSKLGKTISLSEAQPIVDYINITLEQFSKLPEEAKTLILNNFPREKDSLYFDNLGSYLIERQKNFDDYNNFSTTIPEDQESNDIATFPELVKFKLDILDLDFENYKIYYPSHFKKYTNLETLDAALHVSYFGAICANEYNSQDGYQFKDKSDSAYFCEMMPIPNGKLVSRINENFRLETIETKEFLNDFYSKFLPGFNSETVTSDQAPKPNTPNPFAQGVLARLTQYSQEGREYILETYSKEIRNSNSNRGRAKFMQILAADVRLNDFLVEVEEINSFEQLSFGSKIRLAVEMYNDFMKNNTYVGLEEELFKRKLFVGLIFGGESVKNKAEETFKFQNSKGKLELGQMLAELYGRQSNLLPGEQKLIDDAFPDRELTPKTPETPSLERELFDFSDNIEWINNIETFIAEMKQNPSFESGYKAFRAQFQLFENLCPLDVLDNEPIVTDLESAFLAADFTSFCISCVKDENDTLVYEYSAIKTILDNSKNRKRNNQSINENLIEIIKVYISEKEEVAKKSERPYKLLKQFIDDTFVDLSQKQKEELILEIGGDSSFPYDKLINDIENANNRNSNTAKKSIKRQIEKMLDSIQARKEVEPTTSSNESNENISDSTLNQNEDTGNSGGNNNLPPNRPKTAESNEDKSFDEQFILLLEFINNNFGEQRDELITKLLTYCFMSDGVEFLKDFAVHEVFDDYGIIGAKEQVDAALELLGDVVDTQDKKEIIGELITSLEENYNSQEPIENQPKIPEQNSEPRERKLIDGINDIPEEEWEQTVSTAQEISGDGEFEVDLSGVDLVLQLIAASIIFKKRYQELVELKRNSGVTDEYRNKRKELIDDVGDVSNETRTIIYRRRIKFGSNNEIEEGSTNYKVTDLQKRLWGSKTASEQTQTGNKSKQPKNSTRHINAEGKIETTKDTSEYFNFLENLVINLDIKAERLNFLEDNASVFATDKGLAVIVEANKPLQVIYDPTLNIAFYKFLFEDSFAGKINSQQLQEYCYFKNIKYLVKHLKDTIDKEGNSSDEIWKNKIQKLMEEPENFIEWSINLDKNDYDPITIVELRKNGLSFEQITSLYQLMQDYRSQSAIELPIEDGKFKVKTLDELSQNLKFKGESESKNEQKNIALGKIIEALERNSDLITNPFVSDYLESLIGWFDFIDRLSPYYDKYIVRISNSPGLGEFKELSQRLKNLNQTIGNKQNYSNEKKLVVQFIDTIETSFKSAYRTYLNIALQNLKTKK